MKEVRQAGNGRQTKDLQGYKCVSPTATSALTSPAGVPLTAYYKYRHDLLHSYWHSYHRHLPYIHRERLLSTVMSCFPVRFTGFTPFYILLRYSEMPFTPSRSCGNWMTFAIAAMLRESSGGKMTAMS